MRNDYYSNSKDYINRWVVSYADFVTMLLALFMALYAVNGANLQALTESLQKTFGVEKVVEQVVLPVEANQHNDKLLITETVSHTETIEDPIKKYDKHDALFEVLQEKFKNDTSLSVVKETRGTIIRINDTMLFDEGSAIIKSDAKSILEKVITELKNVDNPIIIEGHTDTTPIRSAKYPSNWELSTARATNIIKYLVDNKIISPTRLSAVGYGEYMPIEDNKTRSGRAKNRRVDILVLSNKN